MAGRPIARGMGASPGTAEGPIVFRADDAVAAAAAGQSVILVRRDASAEDAPAIRAAAGIVTTQGGVTGDGAIIARALGKPCVAACPGLRVDDAAERLLVLENADLDLKKGQVVVIDGASGEVWLGEPAT